LAGAQLRYLIQWNHGVLGALGFGAAAWKVATRDRTLPAVEITALLASEPAPPTGEAPVEWLLLTNLPVDTPAQALEKIQWYLCRWQIEVYFRILKSGCRIQKLQLEKLERLGPALACYRIVAWRVLCGLDSSAASGRGNLGNSQDEVGSG